MLLDEVQETPLFEKGLRYLQAQGARVYITGSNAAVFERELASRLRGKVFNYRLFPLSFREFLLFRNEDLSVPARTTKAKSLRRAYFREFLKWGGFPEVVLADHEDLKMGILRSYLDMMLLRDVVERHGVQHVTVLRRLLTKVLRSFTKEYSIHRWYQDLRSQGISISKDAVYRYLSHLFETYFFFDHEQFAQKSGGGRKVYLVDGGLSRVASESPDFGKCFENLCFLDLQRHGTRSTYWKGDEGEIDFVTEDRLLQVTLELTSNNRAREEKPLTASIFDGKGYSKEIVTEDLYVSELGLPGLKLTGRQG